MPKGESKPALTGKYSAFAAAFLRHRSITDAYMEIFPTCKNRNSARSAGSRMFLLPAVQEEVRRQTLMLRDNTDMNQKEWFKEVIEMARTTVDEVTAGDKLRALRLVAEVKDWMPKEEAQDVNFQMLVLAQLEALRRLSPPKPIRTIDLTPEEAEETERLANEPLED